MTQQVERESLPPSVEKVMTGENIQVRLIRSLPDWWSTWPDYADQFYPYTDTMPPIPTNLSPGIMTEDFLKPVFESIIAINKQSDGIRYTPSLFVSNSKVGEHWVPWHAGIAMDVHYPILDAKDPHFNDGFILGPQIVSFDHYCSRFTERHKGMYHSHGSTLLLHPLFAEKSASTIARLKSIPKLEKFALVVPTAKRNAYLLRVLSQSGLPLEVVIDSDAKQMLSVIDLNSQSDRHMYNEPLLMSNKEDLCEAHLLLIQFGHQHLFDIAGSWNEQWNKLTEDQRLFGVDQRRNCGDNIIEKLLIPDF